MAQLDTLTVDNGQAVVSPVPTIRYQYRGHLNSSVIEANELGQVISYEEYYPYGSSAYRAAASGVDLSLKRYRFTGKERDEETGLDYFGVRYYAPWLGRWTAGDPGGFVDGLNLYRYVKNNPVNGIDREGYVTENVVEPDPPPLDPNGGALPEGAIVNSRFTQEYSEFSSGGGVAAPAIGSVRSYDLPTEGGGWVTYTAQFNKETGLFTRYKAGAEKLDTDADNLAYQITLDIERKRFQEIFEQERAETNRVTQFFLELAFSVAPTGFGLARGGLNLAMKAYRLSKVGIRLGGVGLSMNSIARGIVLPSLRSTKDFAINGFKQGAINLGSDYIGKVAAYGGSFSDAFNNLDLADGAVGFVTGGLTRSYSMFGSFYNVVGNSSIDFTLQDGYQTVGGWFGGKQKDPWKVTGDLFFNFVGFGLEGAIASREIWRFTRNSKGVLTGGWYLPETLSNTALKTFHLSYGFGFNSFVNEIFNNNKPRVVEEYGYKGTKKNSQ